MSTVKKKLREIAELITAEKAFYLLIMITMISLPVFELLTEQHDRNFEGQPIIVEAAGIAGVVMVVLHLVLHKGIKYYLTDVIFALLVVFAGLSLANSENMLASVQGYDYDEWLTHFMAYFSLMYAGTMVKDTKLRKNIFKAFIFILIIQGCIGVMQSFGYEFTNCFYDADAATEFHFAYGLTPHYNWYVALMCLATGCVMGLCVFSKGRKPFLLTLAGTTLGMYAILATETRLALLSLAALAVFYPVALLIYKAKSSDGEIVKNAFLRWLVIILILAAMLLVMILGFGKFKQKMDLTISEMNGTATFSQEADKAFNNTASDDSSGSDDDSAADSEPENTGIIQKNDDPMNGWPEEEKYTDFDNFATGRGHIWKFGLACVPDHWMFGVGLDNYRWCFTHAPNLPHDTWSQGKGHNELIHYLVTQGVFQLLTILVLLGYTFVVGIRTTLRAEDRQDRLMSFILVGMVTSYFVQSMFNSSVVNIAPYYWIAIGMVLCKEFQRPFGYRKSLKENTEVQA
ncbi:MAG: O-antigen ligase family protein [Ruminococcus sp.]|nr:O-antigen ligase family protein [Ruminococcus sp.]